MADEAKKSPEIKDIDLKKENGALTRASLDELKKSIGITPENEAKSKNEVDEVEKKLQELAKEKADVLKISKEEISELKADIEDENDKIEGTLKVENGEVKYEKAEVKPATLPETPAPLPPTPPANDELAKAKDFFKEDPSIVKENIGKASGILGGFNIRELMNGWIKGLRGAIASIMAMLGKKVDVEKEEAIGEGYKDVADKKATEATLEAFKKYTGTALDEVKTTTEKKEIAGLLENAGIKSTIEVRGGQKIVSPAAIRYIFEGGNRDTLINTVGEENVANVEAVRGKYISMQDRKELEGMSTKEKLTEVFTINPEDVSDYAALAGNTNTLPPLPDGLVTPEGAGVEEREENKSLEELKKELEEASILFKNAQGNHNELSVPENKRIMDEAEKKVNTLKEMITKKEETEKVEKALIEIQLAAQNAEQSANEAEKTSGDYLNATEENKNKFKSIVIEARNKIYLKDALGKESGHKIIALAANKLISGTDTEKLKTADMALKRIEESLQKADLAVTRVETKGESDLEPLSPRNGNLVYNEKTGKLYQWDGETSTSGTRKYFEVKLYNKSLGRRASTSKVDIEGTDEALKNMGLKVIKYSEAQKIVSQDTSLTNDDGWVYAPPEKFAGKLHNIQIS